MGQKIKIKKNPRIPQRARFHQSGGCPGSFLWQRFRLYLRMGVRDTLVLASPHDSVRKVRTAEVTSRDPRDRRSSSPCLAEGYCVICSHIGAYGLHAGW